MASALPIPKVTPANWGKQLNDAIESRVADLQAQIDALSGGTVVSVNNEAGSVFVDLVEEPPASLFYELQTVGT